MAADIGDRLVQLWTAELAGLPGRFSIALRSPSGPIAGHQEHLPHYAASTIKVAVLAALLDARASGVANATGAALVHARFASRSGGRFDLSQDGDQDDRTWAQLGESVHLLALAEQMITVSSNIATDLILERIGIEAVAGFLNRAGLDAELSLQRLIGDTAAEEAGFTNSVTAAGLAALLAGLASGRWLSATDAATALAILARQTHRDGIPAGLPPGVWSAGKGGWVPGVRHDLALVRPASAPPYVLAVCTTSELPDDAALALVAGLSRLTYQEWTRWHA